MADNLAPKQVCKFWTIAVNTAVENNRGNYLPLQLPWPLTRSVRGPTIPFLVLNENFRGTAVRQVWNIEYLTLKQNKQNKKTTTNTITKTRLFKYIENFTSKNYKIFRWKTLIFFIFLLKNIGCGYSLEPPRRDGSNDYTQSMFWAEIIKIMYTPVNPSFTI